ncbi:16S rRNA methyltransferase [Actinomyces sp. zg-332]|uniref:RsmB/NOP family class I SAM-dependent RNA methyltransferase n=1 Tax=Actinomyces sp. zg-332 TaxID=2708340 RepID=UPI0014218F61|nr:transcription antitermination factor NusB [Actinomyces sp. zg-332]QPK94619.1 16S rRNA methyltransferase [Actinomyces sp. zg-332]
MATAPRKKYSDGYRAKAKAVDKARLAAFECLSAVRKDDAYANIVLPTIIKNKYLNKRDAAFATELSYGTIRMFALYDEIIKTAYTGKTKLDSTVIDLLRLGAHQLFSMRIPTHAAVSETVDLARHITTDGPARTINAIMRRMSERTLQEWEEIVLSGKREDEVLSIKYSHPAWIVRALQDSLVKNGRPAEEVVELLEANCQNPYVCLVARPNLIHPADLAEQAQNILHTNVRPGILSYDAVVIENGTPGRLPAIRDGLAAVQDEGSQLCAQILANIETGSDEGKWLDMCAGPGGKAALLACYAQEQGMFLLANEYSAHRAELVAKTLKSVNPNTYEVVCNDGRELDGLYDKILVDAPCSGLGALRRRPESRWRKTIKDLAQLRILQQELLENAYRLLAPGGVLAYVTCSPHIVETHAQVSAFMEKHEDAMVINAVEVAKDLIPDKELDLGEGPYLQLWTHMHDSDCMFLALIVKK